MKDRSNKIKNMFSAIAPRYDLLNSLLSFGIDRYWRGRAVKELLTKEGGLFLDIAAGTGDISIAVVQKGRVKVVGLDFSLEMLELGLVKTKRESAFGSVMLTNGDALSLPYKDSTFDGVICAFGVRNFTDVPKGIVEMNRVLKKGGKAVVLEFAEPKLSLFKPVFSLYFKHILPLVGGVISGRHEAYRYLHDSVGQFNRVCGLGEVMLKAGFVNVRSTPLSLGIAAIYTGEKPS